MPDFIKSLVQKILGHKIITAVILLVLAGLIYIYYPQKSNYALHLDIIRQKKQQSLIQ